MLGRTEGWGVVRDAFGRLRRRCRISTEGRWSDAYGAIHFDETYSYDDGEIDVWRWAMAPAGDGRYVGAEASVGSGISGQIVGGEYVIAFNRSLPRRPDWLRPRFNSRFCQVGETTALKIARISLLGAPLGVLTAVHEKVAL